MAMRSGSGAKAAFTTQLPAGFGAAVAADGGPLLQSLGRDAASGGYAGRYIDDGDMSMRAHLLQHRKEISMLAAALLGVVCALCALSGWTTAARRRGLGWASRPWEEARCEVQAVGVAYRGTCAEGATMNMVSDAAYLSECVVHGSKRRPDSSTCAKAGDHAYRSGSAGEAARSAEESAKSKSELQQEAAALAEFARINTHHKRRLFGYQEDARSCSNAYLPWAKVRVVPPSDAPTSESLCAYRYGAAAASLEYKWDGASGIFNRLQDVERSSGRLKCWTLPGEDCVVSLEDVSTSSLALGAGHAWVRTLGVACGVGAALACLAALLLQARECGLFGPSTPSGYDCAIPQHDPDTEVELPPQNGLSERMRQLVNIAAGRAADITPAQSGESTLRNSERRSHRVVQVVGPDGRRSSVPRNVAADFVSSAGL
eukprot:TRINITY_DN47923_c0_g1_i2.p1 TRINITY_DN47923_c0_g1~~TRINITY_DN47923_c0_g1_i2.p1  ORF type:complete len:430 (-),score=91.66 TRINITY_DN47923_c0_g1_i2:149-1438(-)